MHEVLTTKLSKFLIVLILFLINVGAYSQAPIWRTRSANIHYTTPKVNGIYKTNLKVSVGTNNSPASTAYAVTYHVKPTTAPSGSDIVAYVNNTQPTPSTIVGKISIAMPQDSTTYTGIIGTLDQNADYAITYIVARNNSTGELSGVVTDAAYLEQKGKRLGSYFYMEYLPDNYSGNSSNYPLMIFLHGAGETGSSITSLADIIANGPPKRMHDEGKDFPFIVLSLQSPGNWSPANLDAFLDSAEIAYRVDSTRIYMTGLSMGGFGTWQYAITHPDRLAAIAPISGGAGGSSYLNQACNLEDKPIWAFHDSLDSHPQAPTTGTINVYNKITACENYTGQMRATYYKNYSSGQPVARHSAWNKAYSDNPSDSSSTVKVSNFPSAAPAGLTIYDWLLQHSLDGNQPPIANAGADTTITLPQNSIVLSGSQSTDSNGTIASYTWTKVSGNSVSMSGANTSTVTVNGLTQGSYTFQLTVTDNVGASASDQVVVTVLPQGTNGFIWNSYDIVMQSNPAQQGLINTNTIPATVEFYQSTDLNGVTKGSLFNTFTSGNHGNSNSAAASYWANSTGNVYPFAGKSTVARGSEPGEGNVPQPSGVFDLQLHPPNTDHLTVAAFVVPQNGSYTVSGLGVRRVYHLGGPVRFKVFDQNKNLLADIQATNNQNWVVDNATYTLGNLSAGDRIYFATDRDDNYNYDFTEVTWTVAMAPPPVVWNSYDIIMQSSTSQQGVINSSVPATVEFYQSTDVDGVTKGSLFTTYNSGNHGNSNSAAASYWANGTGNVYPFAGKSTVARGGEPGEGNVPQPSGVFDLQLHPPNTDHLTVAAFIVPQNGSYTISGLAVRRVYHLGGPVRFKVFDQNKTVIANIQATVNQDWVIDTTTYTLGNLSSGDRIYFTTDRDDNYNYDFTEVTWTVTASGANSSNLRYISKEEVSTENRLLLHPNPVRDVIFIKGSTRDARVDVYNSTGRKIKAESIEKTQEGISLRVSQFQSGLYFMDVQQEGKRYRYKFLKE